ncbi:60S ribosomal eL24 domain-containing protein [Thermochaetoides thermophila DSM 1495]|uniref:60S ribosomal protein L24-like protein n=1 Tax=Chaetomium thermophilum (strain DSM 1495 / CBS 144.50 / IMI 039719) TaxID=759272 RepID=G0S1P9_CHATD|nr:60S ribosomal protein L24-like protein [Thermochaetoides thermophila DSM 1495]EGS22959.1 60S ribosomal protein L24-like protein [Thermochaetoides thermophila DSM 1495]7OLD_LW Chain LW, 60S ribosomal protein L24-like protein [Thermochaetoides thermophila DSM 1495]
MRTYEDTFSGQRIYPGKVRFPISHEGDNGDISHPEEIRTGRRKIAPATRQLRAEVQKTSMKGKLYVRGDSKIFRFQNGKSESLFLQRKNPRRIAWTVLYRRQHRKGISEEVAKKRTRRTIKSQRAIVGASLEVIKERRSMRPEARNAARLAAIKESKEKKAAAQAAKKAEKAKNAAAAAKGQPQGRVTSKQGAKGAPVKVAAKSR